MVQAVVHPQLFQVNVERLAIPCDAIDAVLRHLIPHNLHNPPKAAWLYSRSCFQEDPQNLLSIAC